MAPTVDGTDVGESWVAYQWVRRLAERHDVTLLTYHKRDRPPAAPQLPGVRVVEWSEPPLLGRYERLNSLLKPGYLPFWVRARRWIRTALANGERFDIGHQLVPVAARYPSPLAGSGLPYVVGPIGGSLSSPPGFAEGEDTTPWYVGLRSLDGWRLRHDPVLRRTYTQAACVLGIAGYMREVLQDVPLRRFEVLSDTGIGELPPPVDRSGPRDVVRLLFVGRVIRTKGARDAVAAMEHLRDLPVRLDVIGDGFDLPTCRSLVERLGVGDRVSLHGRLPREEIDAYYRGADVFVFPSFREPGGTVTFEAMGFGLPLVVVDRGGPGSAVDDSCGIKVPAVDPAQLARDVAAAVRRLATDPALRAELGDGARRRVAEIGLWDGKVTAMEKLYTELATTPSR